MASNLASMAGWYFLPSLVTGYVQTALYAIFMRAGEPKPAPGSARYVRDRTRVQILVIVAYLLYTIYEADWQILRTPDLYSILGVPFDAEDKTIQSRFRRLTLQYHPDKATGPDKSTIEAIYVQMKLARDILVDPAKRFAYDRFGPDILGWQRKKTIRDFVLAGAQNIAVFYIGSAGFLVLLSTVGYLRSGMFWRFFVMGSLFAIEMHIVTRPVFPWFLTKVLNPILTTTALRVPYLPFQLIVLMRKLTLTFFIALSQLGPLLKSPQQRALAQPGAAAIDQQMLRLDALTNATDQELGRLLGMELIPFAGDRSALVDLRGSVKEWLVQNTIRNDPEVRTAAASVLEQRRTETPIAPS